MSTDFNSICHKHKLFHHLGQRMGGMHTFGYGSKDSDGREACATFILDHLGCDLRIVDTDSIPIDYLYAEERHNDQPA